MILIDRDKLLKTIPSEEMVARMAVMSAQVVDAIPIEWIKEWIEEHHEYASRVTITWLLDDWEQEKQNGNFE